MTHNGATDVIDYLDALLDDSAPVADRPRVAAPPPVAAPAAAAQAPAPVAAATKPAATKPAAAAATGVQPGPITIAAASRWLRVVVGSDSYALELLRVQEVVRVVPIVPMRGATRAVLGVMNLRGRIVPVFDLGLWLHAGQVDVGEQSRIVVIERDDELIGVLVSAVEDVVTLGRDRIEPPLPGNAPGVVLGVARVGACPTVLFDAYALYG
ncbi:chemotaxis protein CheW [Luteimonas saliphila]|uniref:chemotaxis protein CheW n=1 Tax=Luteimonas saliphila TaxID=2804919 RepID=UPI00192D9178|nr:chemotaxis protein CheW [Luteimonas saliphila]